MTLRREPATAYDAAEVVHLDPAGCARAASAAVAAQIDHLHREVARGGIVAQREADGLIEAGCARLAALTGFQPDEVALVEGAAAAFAALLGAWPLRPGDGIGVVRSEFGSNRMFLDALSARRGTRLVELPVDPAGRIDVERLPSVVRDLVLVVFPHVPSHRGVRNAAADVTEVCRAAGVAVVVDVAQSAGHVPLDGMTPDALVGTSRKWLRGPRGVGYLAVRHEVAERLVPERPNLDSASWADGGVRWAPGTARFRTGECAVAARVGFAAALDDRPADPRLLSRTAALGAAARAVLHGVGGWTVQEPADEPTGTVTLAHSHLSPEQVHRRLLVEHRIAASWLPVTRAPLDLSRPLLRASFHGAYASDEDAVRLRDALAAISR